MYKKTPKIYRLANKQPKREGRSTMMMVLRQPASDNDVQLNFNSNNKSYSLKSLDHKINQKFWSNDIEDIASHKILEHWHIIEHTLFDEEDQLPEGILFNECLQWRNQLTHLRILGRNILGLKNEDLINMLAITKVNSTIKNEDTSAKKNEEENELPYYKYNYFFKESITYSTNQQNQKQAKDEILNIIVDFICKKLSGIEAEKKIEDLSFNLDTFLKILPAPACAGKNPLVSNYFNYNIKKVNTLTEKEENVNKKKEKGKKLEFKLERNKLGTIFNEKIIVSPVPFISMTRKSFSTLRRTSVHFLEENHICNNSRSVANKETGKDNLYLARKTSLLAEMHIQSWKTPVCSTIWPKNIKLTPIDTARLPSSKRRSTKILESLTSHRSHNSLSPISHSIHSTFNSNDIHHSSLEIQDSHIVVTQIPEYEGKCAKENLGCSKYIYGQ